MKEEQKYTSNVLNYTNFRIQYITPFIKAQSFVKKFTIAACISLNLTKFSD